MLGVKRRNRGKHEQLEDQDTGPQLYSDDDRPDEGGWIPEDQFDNYVRAWEERIDVPKRNLYLDRAGWYQKRSTPSLTTTRQGEALNLAQVRRQERFEGWFIGVDRLTRTPVVGDAFSLYGADLNSINATAIGDVGTAKTSNGMTSMARHLSLPDRQGFVYDKKPHQGQGEYAKLAEAVGVNTVIFGRSGTRLNLLDRRIVASAAEMMGGADKAPASQQTLIKAVLEDAMGRQLEETEAAALNQALVSVAAERSNIDGDTDEGTPTVDKLAHRLLNPLDADLGVYGERWKDRAGDWGLAPGLALRRLCDGDLRGLVDGVTSDDIVAALDHPLVHFDISSLPEGGPAIRVVMTVLNTLVSNIAVQRSAKRLKTVQGIEEAWHVADGSTGELVRRNLKLSRGLGLSTQTTFHHPSDFPEGSSGQALMKENGIIYAYRQGRAKDAAEMCELFDFPPGTEDLLMNLPRGVCLAKIGTAAPVVMEHIRSPQEVLWTDTDDVIKGHGVDQGAAA